MALSADSNTYLLTYALDEEPLGEEDQSQSYLTGAGHIFGEANPSASYRRTYKFNVLNQVEPLFPTSADTITSSLRNVLNKYYAGQEMRVWRNFGGDMDPYDIETNPDGYTDMVVIDANAAEYAWEDNVMTRFAFVLEGVDA